VTTEKHSIRNGIISTVVGGAVLAALCYFAPSIWETVKKVSAGGWGWLAALATFELPIWAVVAMTLILYGMYRLIIVLNSSKPAEPSWRDYTSDVFFSIRWRWEYTLYQPKVVHLHAICPVDCTPLVFNDMGGFGRETSFACETCGQTFGPIHGSHEYIKGSVERRISGKVTSGSWKQSVEGADG
jgi:hypothetical protein